MAAVQLDVTMMDKVEAEPISTWSRPQSSIVLV